MDEREVIKRLGTSDEIIKRSERMSSGAWICSTCREIIRSTVPIPVPAPCPRCGGIAFETVRE